MIAEPSSTLSIGTVSATGEAFASIGSSINPVPAPGNTSCTGGIPCTSSCCPCCKFATPIANSCLGISLGISLGIGCSSDNGTSDTGCCCPV